MRDYDSGRWGFKLVWGLRASVFPRALALAIPNAAIAFLLGWYIQASDEHKELTDNAFSIWAGFSSVLFFVLYFRSNVAYNRWWEGGTLLQQTRGEWFNAYSSLIAFTSPEPAKEAEVEAYQHMLARLMSLLFCSALQQVSPNRNRPFEIIDSAGIDPKSLYFLSESNDRVEVILQWVQRSTILNMASGVLPIPPPVMSRAFQEISRGIVNLQNARKIAEFPFPFPYAQTSIVMLLIHWAMCPVLSSILLNHFLAAVTCFVVVFFLWCINFIALELESPFGSDDNDLPMTQMQIDWNKSVATLLAKRANQPPHFSFNAPVHRKLEISMSDGSYACPRRMTITEHLDGRRGTEGGGEPSLCGAGGRGSGGGGGSVASRMKTSTRELGGVLGIADPDADGVVSGSEGCDSDCKGGDNHTGAEGHGNYDAKVAEPNGAMSECSSRQSSTSRRSRDGRKKLSGNQLQGVLASSPGGVIPVQAEKLSNSSTSSAPADIRAQAKKDKVSISQATAAALSTRRASTPAVGSAAVRAATAPASSSASTSSGQGPDVALADRLITNCTGNRLVINCPGMECFSPFPRLKKPRNTHRGKQARSGRALQLQPGEDPENNE